MPSQFESKKGWINIYQMRDRVCPGTQIYPTEEIAKSTARHKSNWLTTIFVEFTYKKKEWDSNPSNRRTSNASPKI